MADHLVHTPQVGRVYPCLRVKEQLSTDATHSSLPLGLETGFLCNVQRFVALGCLKNPVSIPI